MQVAAVMSAFPNLLFHQDHTQNAELKNLHLGRSFPNLPFSVMLNSVCVGTRESDTSTYMWAGPESPLLPDDAIAETQIAPEDLVFT